MHNFTSISTMSPNFRTIRPVVTENSSGQNLGGKKKKWKKKKNNKKKQSKNNKSPHLTMFTLKATYTQCHLKSCRHLNFHILVNIKLNWMAKFWVCVTGRMQVHLVKYNDSDSHGSREHFMHMLIVLIKFF